MENSETIRLIIAEDQEDIRQTLEAYISFEPKMECLGTFANGKIAWNWLVQTQNKIDVALLDIDMPEMNGIELAQKIKDHFPETQCLICTIYDDSDKIFAALEAGASGYLLKKSTPSKVLEAIKEVHLGGAPMSAEIARRVVQSFSKKSNSKNNLIEYSLTTREKEILELLSQGFLYKEIASQLFISTETVRRHVHNIYEKLHVSNRTEALLKYSGR
jgi:DNA-binding NarL/FixJ family response regulator